jgi:ribonuclease I
VNRTRKSKTQKAYLWKIYRQLDGQTPPREKINSLAKELKLSVNQIYKWFWDTNKKVEEDNELAI